MPPLSFATQLLHILAAGLLMISFAMLAQRRTRRLIVLLAWQGAVLTASTLLVATTAHLPHLYYSAALTLVEKVFLMPWILLRLMRLLGNQPTAQPDLAAPHYDGRGIALAPDGRIAYWTARGLRHAAPARMHYKEA